MLSTGTQSVNTRATGNFSKLLQVDRLFPKFCE